jgi:CrcB protein
MVPDVPVTGQERSGELAYLLAALGGALGALARWGVATALSPSPGAWPWATLLVNLTGCLLIGALLAVLLSRFPTSALLRPFLAVGVLGGYTTFSTFAVDLVRLGATGAWLVAVGYLLASVLGGIACVLLGLAGARAVLHPTETALEDLVAGEDQS